MTANGRCKAMKNDSQWQVGSQRANGSAAPGPDLVAQSRPLDLVPALSLDRDVAAAGPAFRLPANGRQRRPAQRAAIHARVLVVRDHLATGGAVVQTASLVIIRRKYRLKWQAGPWL
jgi:hypothetical protein